MPHAVSVTYPPQAPPMVASNAVPIEPRRHWVARTGVEAPEAENRLAVAAAMLAPHAGDAAAIDLPELPSRWE